MTRRRNELSRVRQRTYSEGDLEVLKAVDYWRQLHHGEPPAVTTVFEIIRKLGYEKLPVKKIRRLCTQLQKGGAVDAGRVYFSARAWQNILSIVKSISLELPTSAKTQAKKQSKPKA